MQNLKNALEFAFELTKTISEATSDKKLTVAEWLSITWQSIKIGDHIKKAKDIWSEVQELTASQKAELHIFVAEHFKLDINTTKASEIEALVEESLMLIIGIASISDKIVSLSKKQ